eukprot:31497-Pelagococcus_subviridis.AAC.37
MPLVTSPPRGRVRHHGGAARGLRELGLRGGGGREEAGRRAVVGRHDGAETVDYGRSIREPRGRGRFHERRAEDRAPERGFAPREHGRGRRERVDVPPRDRRTGRGRERTRRGGRRRREASRRRRVRALARAHEEQSRRDARQRQREAEELAGPPAVARAVEQRDAGPGGARVQGEASRREEVVK